MRLVVTMALVTAGCGGGGAKPPPAAGVPGQGNEEAASLTDQTEQAINASEDVASAVFEGVSPTHQIQQPITAPVITSSCKPGDRAATADLTDHGEGTTNVMRGSLTQTSTVSINGAQSQVWKAPPGEAAGGVGCDERLRRVVVRWSDPTVVDGLSMAVKGNESQTRRVVAVDTARGLSRTVQADSNHDGTRHTVFSAPTVTSSALTLTKSISYQLQRGRTYTNTLGDATTFTSTITASEASPLTVTVTRAPAPPFALQSEVVNGALTATKVEDKSVVNLTLANVTYDLTQANTAKCQPVSGTVTGTSRPASGAPATFTIKFGDTSVASGVSISWNGGAAVEYDQYNGRDCDLARS